MRLLVAPGRRALAHASRSLGAVAAAASSDPTLADLVARTRAASRGPPSSTSSSLCVHGSDTAAEAVRFEPHAPPRVVTTTTAALGLPPRDAAGLRPPSASGGGQRATLVAREVAAGSAIDGDALILVRTEAVRAAVGARAAHVFPCRRPADTAALLAAVDAAAAAAAAPFGPPFELGVLEALLSESVRHFERRTRQLRVLADGVASDVGRALRWAGGAAASTGELGRLLPVQRALTEVLHDVREARGAVESVTASPRALEGLCLTDREKRGRREAGGDRKSNV
jgi:magnesium transporter